MPVLHGGVAHIAKLGLPSGCLAIKPAVRVAGARMGVVLALLAVEVGAIIIVAATVLGAKAFLRSPGFDQRSVHRKMLVRQQRLDLRMVQKPGHELREHIAVLQPLPVLGEGGRVPDRIVRRQSHEPAVQKIVVQLLHQLAFRADAVEHLQQQGAQQLLRRDRRTSLAGVEPPKAAVQITQNIPDKFPHLPQRMVRRHTLIRRDVRK